MEKLRVGDLGQGTLSRRGLRSAWVIGVAVATLLAVAQPARAAVDAGASPEGLSSIADAFLIDSPKPGTSTAPAEWFCKSPKVGTKVCPIAVGQTPLEDSPAIAERLIQSFRDTPQQQPAYLRVGKARNDCMNGDEGTLCSIGVPAAPDPGGAAACAGEHPLSTSSDPYCALKDLADLDTPAHPLHLGLIIGASTESSDNEESTDATTADANAKEARPVKDIAWQACYANRQDQDNLYTFLFLDNAYRLKKISDTAEARAVRLIQEGLIIDEDGQERSCWRIPHDPSSGMLKWSKLITNDHNYKPDHREQLDTGAWAHANDMEALNPPINATQAFTSADQSFVDDVRHFDSIPVVRFEVTPQTGRFGLLTPQQQCSLLNQMASQQDDHNFHLAYPLYVHGYKDPTDSSKDNAPYDSYAKGTFDKQLSLIADPENGACPARSYGSDGQPVSSTRRIAAIAGAHPPNGGRLYVKENGIAATWVDQRLTGVTKVVIAGNRIIALLDNGVVMGKSGSLDASNPWKVIGPWVPVSDIAASGSRIAVVTSPSATATSSSLYVKTVSGDDLSVGSWGTPIDSSVRAVALDGTRTASIHNDDTLYVKDGSQSTSLGSVAQVVLTGGTTAPVIGASRTIAASDLLTKSGAFANFWTSADSGVNAFAIDGGRMAIVDNNGLVLKYRRTPNANLQAIPGPGLPFTQMKGVSIDADRLAVLTQGGDLYVKEADDPTTSSAPWTLERGSVSGFAVGGTP